MKYSIKTIKMLIICMSTLSIYAQSQQKDSIKININKAIEVALNESPTMRIADRDIQTKKYTKAEQMVALFPNVSLSATYNRTLKKQVMTMDFMGSPMEIEVGTDNSYAGGVGVGMPIINAALWNSIQLSQIGIETALEAARASKLELVYEVKKAFYSMLLAKETYDVLKKNYQTVSLTYENILSKYEVGMASEFDKLRAEVQLKNQKPTLISSKNNYDLSIMMLKVMIGLNVDEAVVFEGEMADYENFVENSSLPFMDSLSMVNNVNLKQLELAEKQLKKAKDIVIANACPSLNLSGSYQYMSMNNDFKFNDYRWNPYSVVGLTLSIPLVSWAGTAYQIKSSNLAIQNIQDQRLALERNLTISINNSLNNMRNAMEQLSSNKETMLQAEKAYEISLKQYEIGMGTWLDLQSSEMMLISSKLTYNQSIYSYVTAYAELEKTLGNESIK